MKLSVTFSEISEIIKNKVGKEVNFECVNENTCAAKVSLRWSVFSISPTVKVTVVDVGGNDICLRFGDLIQHISGWFTDRQEYYSISDDGLVVVHLDKIEQLKKALEKIVIDEIKFNDDGVNVVFHLKQFLR